MATYCPSCAGMVREKARYCSHCGTPLPIRNQTDSGATSGYRSTLRETAYLEPEWLEKAEAALKEHESTRLATVEDAIPFISERMGTYRNVALVMLLPFLTFGIYALYWWWRTGHEIRNYLGSREPMPLRDLFLLLLTCGFWRLYMHYNYASQIAEMQERARLPRSDYLKLVCPLLSLFFFGFISFGLMQDELNKIWQVESYGPR